MLKESPIIFSPPMVKAIIDGAKTMTRRVIKCQPPKNMKTPKLATVVESWSKKETGKHYWYEKDWISDERDRFRHPYGYNGDLLYVKERFCIGAICEGDTVDGYSNGEFIDQCKDDNSFIPYEYAIREGISIEDVKWKPSIFMFKKDARIWLKLTNIRVEQLQDISEEDCFSEGIDEEGEVFGIAQNILDMAPSHENDIPDNSPAKAEFKSLWDSINGKPRKDGQDISWDANPWVWVVEFERTEKPISTTE